MGLKFEIIEFIFKYGNITWNDLDADFGAYSWDEIEKALEDLSKKKVIFFHEDFSNMQYGGAPETYFSFKEIDAGISYNEAEQMGWLGA